MSVIEISQLSKVYNIYKSPTDRVKEAFHPLRKKFHSEFYALEDVSFSVEKGDVVGIIGKNGAGKSTLLKILTGVLSQSSGNFSINGRVSALLELGGGINPEYTGIENIYFNGSILGMTKEEVDTKIQDIIDFADIGEFINVPVKTYSSGMTVRLAFAIAINIEPDILIVDEALSVGDFRFQQKSFRRMRELMDKAKAILFVTHDIGTVLNFCNKVIWLKDGKVFKSGKPKDICKQYLSYMAFEDVGEEGKEAESETVNANWINADTADSYGEGKVKILSASFCTKEHDHPLYQGSEQVTLTLKINVFEPIADPIIGFIIKDHLGNSTTGANTIISDIDLPAFNQGINEVSFSFKLPNIKNGDYTISPAFAEGTMANHIQHHWVHDLIQFTVRNADPAYTIGLNHILENVRFTRKSI